MSDILQINALLKYIEHILHVVQEGDENITLKEIRKQFEEKFRTFPILLSQHFGILRLLPIVLIREDIKGAPNKDDVKNTIMIIRHAICHNGFGMDADGYAFSCNHGTRKLTYEEFNEFVYRVENLYHAGSL